MASELLGRRALRKFLRNIDPAARAELKDEMTGIADRLLGRAKAETPEKTGALRAALSATVRVGVRIILQLGLLTKRKRSRYFYGYILDAGRKAYTRKGRHIGAIDPEKYNFVFGRRADFKTNELPPLRSFWTKVLQRAAAGTAGDD